MEILRNIFAITFFVSLILFCLYLVGMVFILVEICIMWIVFIMIAAFICLFAVETINTIKFKKIIKNT